MYQERGRGAPDCNMVYMTREYGVPREREREGAPDCNMVYMTREYGVPREREREGRPQTVTWCTGLGNMVYQERGRGRGRGGPRL